MKNVAAAGCMVVLLAVVLVSIPAFGQTSGTGTYYEGDRDGMAQVMLAISPAYGVFSLGLLMLEL